MWAHYGFPKIVDNLREKCKYENKIRTDPLDHPPTHTHTRIHTHIHTSWDMYATAVVVVVVVVVVVFLFFLVFVQLHAVWVNNTV